MQRQAPTPSHHWFSVGSNPQEAPTSILQATTCKEAPTPINFLQAPTYRRLQPQSATTDILSSYNLMWKHQLPSIFCRHQPTGGSYLSQLQLTSIKLQLDREAPTSLLFQKKNTCWFTLDISSVLYLLLCCSSTLISDLHHICSALPSSLLFSSILHTQHSLYSHSLTSCSFLIFFNYLQFCCTLSPLLILFSSTLLPLDIILFYTKIASWLFVFHWEFEMGSHVSLPSAFSSLFSSLRKM